MVNVTVALGVPVNVSVELVFEQTVAGLKLAVAVGKGITVILKLLGCELIQLGEELLEILNTLTVVFVK